MVYVVVWSTEHDELHCQVFADFYDANAYFNNLTDYIHREFFNRTIA